MKLKNIFAVLCTFLLTVFAGATLRAQDISGTISGTVLDGTGAAVSGATVTVTNTDKDEKHVTHSNDHGEYTVPNLLVGHYTVTVEATNFKKSEQNEIMLNVHDQLGINFKLELGSATQTVTVNAGELHLETQTATQQGLVAPKEIHELPLNTRNFVQLVTLMPGVSSSSQLDTFYIGNSLPSGTTATIPFSFNGERNSAAYWTLDGADNVDRGSNLTLLDFPSVDAIEEFKVLRGQYDPEFGRSEGAQITVVTKSGGSSYHGGAYEFFRNDVLQANNPLNKAATIPIARPPLRYNDFGYTIGGPISIPHFYDGKKHKTYFFFSQEVRRVITYGTVTALVPTASLLAGNFSGTVCTAFTGTTCTATGNHIATIDPVAAAYIKDIWNLMPGVNSGANGSIVNLRNVFDGNQQLIRVDHAFSDKFSIFGRFIHDGIPTIEPGGLFTGAALPGVSTTATSDPGYNFIIHAVTTMSPNLLNDGGFQYSQGAIVSVPIGLDNSALSPDIKPILPFTNTLGRIPALALTGMSSITGFGPYNDYNRNYNLFDNQTWIHGKHTMKFGISYNHYQKTENTAGNNVGSFSVTNSGQTGQGATPDTLSFEQSWANFLLGRVATFTQASIDITPNILTNQTEFYAQDSWRILQNLTITYGFRYSFFRQPIDANKESSNFDATLFVAANAPTIDSNGLICVAAPCAGGGVPNPNYNPLNGIIVNNTTSPFGAKVSNEDNGNIAPRFGFAWQPWNNGKTVIRGGYGMFYDSTLFGIIEQNIFANPPFVNSVTISNVTLDNPAGGTATVSATPKALHATMLPNSTPYVQEVSLDVQHEFKGGFFLDVAYVGNHATNLLGEEDINMPMPGAYVAAGLSTTILNSSGVVTGTTIGRANAQNETLVNIIRPFKGYGPITAIESGFSSNYNGLQVEAKKQMRDFLFKVDYTWSKALTNNQTDRSTAPQNLYNPNGDYGPLQQDRTQIFSADFVYSLPWLRSQQGMVGHFLGGWQVSGIVSAATGLPLTVTTTEALDPAGDGACSCSASPAGLRPDIVGNPNAGAPHTLTSWFNGAAFANVPATATRPGTEARGAVRGPGYQIWNMALEKNIRVTERAGFEFRAEAFNLFNHTNPFGVGTQLGSSTFNTITNYRDPRVLQLGLKFNF